MAPVNRKSQKAAVPLSHIFSGLNKQHDKRFSSGMEFLSVKKVEGQGDASALQDEIDMLQEENEDILEKLRFAQAKCEETEARARELEKQVFILATSLCPKYVHSSEALKDAQHEETEDDLFSLWLDVENAKIKAIYAVEQLRETDFEAKSLRSMTQRIILTQEEMEEVVLKRCWFARYWGLAVDYSICADIAVLKFEYWSSFAPLPYEVVISAGYMAKDQLGKQGTQDAKRSELARDLNEFTGKGNIENMLSVEKGLRELASLKVEESVILALAKL